MLGTKVLRYKEQVTRPETSILSHSEIASVLSFEHAIDAVIRQRPHRLDAIARQDLPQRQKRARIGRGGFRGAFAALFGCFDHAHNVSQKSVLFELSTGDESVWTARQARIL